MKNLRNGALLLLGLACSSAAWSQQALLLSLKAGQGADRVYSTRGATQLQVVEGARVILQRSRGRDYRLEAAERGWTWFQVQQVPAEETYIAVTPSIDGDRVALDVHYAGKDGDDTVSLTTSVVGELGEWIVLLGQDGAALERGGRRYSTAADGQRLAIKVERLPAR